MLNILMRAIQRVGSYIARKRPEPALSRSEQKAARKVAAAAAQGTKRPAV
jgi:hypothetical protein